MATIITVDSEKLCISQTSTSIVTRDVVYKIADQTVEQGHLTDGCVVTSKRPSSPPVEIFRVPNKDNLRVREIDVGAEHTVLVEFVPRPYPVGSFP